MVLEEVFSSIFIEQMKNDKDTIIDLNGHFVYITAGFFIRARFNIDSLKKVSKPIYLEFKESHPQIANKIMSIVLGRKDE